MKKCDVIIPVYNAPDYVDICVFALINNTNLDDIGKIYLMDDCSNDVTRNLLDNLGEKYKDKKVEVIHNKENLGFIKNVNKGFSISKSDYVMLLNTDCFVTKNTVGKLMKHMEADEKMGLICPVCSNAANLTIPIFEGFSYQMMNTLLENKFEGMNFDACTVVGNCLMISKKCIDEVGYFDEIYGMGYGDETDYQFKSMSKGFSAKVAIDTYVFHKAEVSFNTTNKKRSERLEKNRKIFFDRWGDEYYKLLKEYEKNDPIKYIYDHLTEKDKIPNLDFAFVMQQMGKGSGGVMYVANIINYLSILGLNIGIINYIPGTYDGIMIFNPVTPNLVEKVKPKYLLPTLYDSVWLAQQIAKKSKSEIIYFSQGYEFYFLNGTRYGEVESTYKVVDYVLTISSYLSNCHKKMFGIDSLVVKNGIDYNLLYHKNLTKPKKPTIIMNIRTESLKAGYILIDVIKQLSLKCKNIKIIVINNANDTHFCVNNNKNVEIEYIDGPVDRNTIYEKLNESSIIVDSSISEGFGLLPLEAMACGVVPVVSNAMGNKEYCNSKNSIVIDEVNNSDKYVEKIIELIDNPKKLEEIALNAIETAKKYSFDDTIFNYYNTLTDVLNNKYKKIDYSITDEDKKQLLNYELTDKKYQTVLNNCKKLYKKSTSTVDKTKSNRLHNCKVLFKEFLKSMAFFIKQFLKSMKDKNYRL